MKKRKNKRGKGVVWNDPQEIGVGLFKTLFAIKINLSSPISATSEICRFDVFNCQQWEKSDLRAATCEEEQCETVEFGQQEWWSSYHSFLWIRLGCEEYMYLNFF